MTGIPASREGYAVDVARNVAHRRYADHARGLPRIRTEAELRTWLPEGRPCAECFPPPAPPTPAPAASRTRTRKAAIALVDAGYEPASAASAVESGDLGQLVRDVEPTSASTQEQEDPDAPGTPDGGAEE